jgi:hypothetical protein
MNIVLIKLITGEDVVADIAKTEEINGKRVLTLNKPARIVLTPEGAAMIPMPPFAASESLSIMADHIVYTAEPDDEVRNAYNSKFGSGLVVPGLSIVT